jgi:hypothetical protein
MAGLCPQEQGLFRSKKHWTAIAWGEDFERGLPFGFCAGERLSHVTVSKTAFRHQLRCIRDRNSLCGRGDQIEKPANANEYTR